MHSSNISFSHNPDQLTDAQKSERTELASATGAFVFVIPLLILFVGVAVLAVVWLGLGLFPLPTASSGIQADKSKALSVLGLLAAPGVIALIVFIFWVVRSALKKYKHLRELCGNTWPTSPWRKVMWSSWLAMNLCICAIAALSVIWFFLRNGGFIGLVLDQVGVYISAGLLVPTAILLFCLWRVERPLEIALLQWATLASQKRFRNSWGSLILAQGVNLFFFFFESGKTKIIEFFFDRIALSIIMSVIALCGVWLAQRRMTRLRATGKVMEDPPAPKVAAPRDLNRTDDIWDAATLAQMHALSPSDAEKEAHSNLTSATGCAITVWLAVGLIVLALATCAVLGIKAFQANWDTALNITKTMGLVIVVGGAMKKPATQLFSLYKELRAGTQQDWHVLWRTRLLSYVTSNLSLVLIFAFAALQLPFAAFALPATLVAVGIGLDLHGIQTVKLWSTYRLQKQNWKDAWLAPILFVVAIPALARLCRLNAYIAESLIEGWGVLRQTWLHNPFWGLPDVWLMVIIAIWTPIEVWLYLRQLRLPGD